jgi:hypothetical protein
VEQHFSLALRYADFACITELGKIVLEGPPPEIVANGDVREFYRGSEKARRVPLLQEPEIMQAPPGRALSVAG